MLFKALEGENAIIQRNGVYRQCDLYVRNGQLFAKVSNGYVRLYANGSTSQDRTRLDTLAYDGPLYSDRLGRLTTVAGEGTKTIGVSDDGQLLLPNKA